MRGFLSRWTVPVLFVSSSILCVMADTRPRWFLVEPLGLQAEWKPLADHRSENGHTVVSILVHEGQDWEGVRDTLRVAGAGTVAGDCVVLAGDAASDAAYRVPAGRGALLRMGDRFTDAAYAKALQDSGREINVGRLPARNPAEARIMVEKILKFEASNEPGLWRRRVGLLVGNPSATSQTNSLVDGFVSSIADDQLQKVHPAWTFRVLAHLGGHAFQTSGASLRDETLAVLSDSYALCAYLGHSSAHTLISKGRKFFTEKDWSLIAPIGTHGVLFSTGCNALDCSATDSTSYGYTAIRSPGGPAAFIGATLESWAAMGFLALGGIVEMLSVSDPPERLGALWTLVSKHLATGTIEPGQFAMMDQFDGSQGRVPLDQQRLEHLEMWQLLGDPAMQMPRMPHILSLAWRNELDETGPFCVEGTLPNGFSAPAVTVTIERPLTAPPAHNPVGNVSSNQRDRALLDNLRRANCFVLASAVGIVDENKFRASIERPTGPLPDSFVIRAVAVHRGQWAQGTLQKRKKPKS